MYAIEAKKKEVGLDQRKIIDDSRITRTDRVSGRFHPPQTTRRLPQDRNRPPS